MMLFRWYMHPTHINHICVYVFMYILAGWINHILAFITDPNWTIPTSMGHRQSFLGARITDTMSASTTMMDSQPRVNEISITAFTALDLFIRYPIVRPCVLLYPAYPANKREKSYRLKRWYEIQSCSYMWNSYRWEDADETPQIQ